MVGAAILSGVCDLGSIQAASEQEVDPLPKTIRDAQRRVVKIYGAGGLRQLEAYQSGIAVSPDGEIVTALSYVLDTDDLAIVLDDGRKFEAEFLGSDPVLEIALLKIPIENEQLPYYDLAASVKAEPGDRILAISNLYGIAAGEEPVSALQGIVSAIAPLEAGRGSFQANYRGLIYVVDAYANNPGAAGGALVNWEGQLLGILGKELKGRVTGAWLNYALPAEVLAASVDGIRSGKLQLADSSAGPGPVEPMTLADLGLALVPNILARTPPFIDGVRPDSPADLAGLRSDDLLAFVASQPVASCDEAIAAVARCERQESLSLGILRDGALIEVELGINLPTASREAAAGEADSGHGDDAPDTAGPAEEASAKEETP